jgi:hypothetical protein
VCIVVSLQSYSARDAVAEPMTLQVSPLVAANVLAQISCAARASKIFRRTTSLAPLSKEHSVLAFPA